MKFSGAVEHGPSINQLEFVSDLDHDLDPGIFKGYLFAEWQHEIHAVPYISFYVHHRHKRHTVLNLLNVSKNIRKAEHKRIHLAEVMQHTHTDVTNHFFDLSRGGGLRGMRNSALIGCISHSATTQNCY